MIHKSRPIGMLALVLPCVTACWPVAVDAEGAHDNNAIPDASTGQDASGPSFVDAGRDGGTHVGRDASSWNITEALTGIPGMTITSSTSYPGGPMTLDLEYDQPEDHDNPSGPHFKQHAVLIHKRADYPTVLFLSGYDLSNYTSELTEMLDANQLEIEHRFFADSIATAPDWSHLTVEQAARDLHRFVDVVKPLYRGRWISTGHSKGGMTAVYHRRFFPDDVDATVAYVAPHSTRSDSRYLEFLASVGDAECRDRLVAFQREVLKRRESMMTKMNESAAASGYTFNQVDAAQALEHAVIESYFMFWQYSFAADCTYVPAVTATDTELWGFLNDVTGVMSNWSDQALSLYLPYYFQAATELGYPAPYESPLADLLQFAGTDIPETYVPASLSYSFDPAPIQGVTQWLSTEGRSLMFIYGENDPWTAAAFQLGNAEDSFVFTVPGGNHGASILGLSDVDQQQALSIVERWMGVTPSPPPAFKTSPPTVRFTWASRRRL